MAAPTEMFWTIIKARKPTCTTKAWLNRDLNFWLVCYCELCAKFTSKGEARKALNERLSFEIKNWGLEHVKRWTYKVEQIDK